MNLNQLYYFRKLAELEHYTNTAKELYITQPTLSGSIASLEEELGLALFQRKGRNVKLTKYGETFYQHVDIALHELEKGIEKMQAISGALEGVIDIGCIPTLVGNFLPQVINEYLGKNCVKTKFNIYSGMTLDILDNIKSMKYDLGLCSFVDNEPDLQFNPITSQEFIILVNDTHPLAKENFINLSSLKGCPIITYRQNLPIGKTVMKYLEFYNLSAIYEFDDEISIAGMISSSNQIALVASTPFLSQFKNLKQIRTNIPKDARIIYLVSNKKAYSTKPVDIFMDYLLERSKEFI